MPEAHANFMIPPKVLHEMFVYHTPTPEAVLLHTDVNQMTEAVAQVWNKVKVPGHAADVLAAAQAL